MGYNKDYEKSAFIRIMLVFRSYRNSITKIMIYNKSYVAFLHQSSYYLALSIGLLRRKIIRFFEECVNRREQAPTPQQIAFKPITCGGLPRPAMQKIGQEGEIRSP
jgi:hypothetical protein